MLLDEAASELVFEIPVGEAGSALRQLRVPVTQGVCGWVARNARPAIVNETRGDSRFDTQRRSEQRLRHAQRSWPCRCMARGRVSGVSKCSTS